MQLEIADSDVMHGHAGQLICGRGRHTSDVTYRQLRHLHLLAPTGTTLICFVRARVFVYLYVDWSEAVGYSQGMGSERTIPV